VLFGDSTREHVDDEEFELEDLWFHAMRGRAEEIGVQRVWGFRKETT
jgi:hypothetical protein